MVSTRSAPLRPNLDIGFRKHMSAFRICSAIVSLLLASCAGTDTAQDKSVEELIAVLRGSHWRTRERAAEELITRGRDEVALALLTELDKTSDARTADRITKVLNGWGMFAIGTRVVDILAKLEKWNRQLKEDLVSIRSDKDQSSKLISDRLMKRFAIVVHTLRMERDEEAVSFRKEMIMTMQRVRLMLTQERKSEAIGIVADVSRSVTATIDSHGDLDRDGIPTSWELAHGLDPILDDHAQDPDGDGRNNGDEFLRGSDPNQKD